MTQEEQLLAAIEEENAGLVFKILRSGQIDFECDAFKKKHPLHAAVFLKNLSIVRLLVEYGASYNSTDEANESWTPFERAVNSGSKEIVDYFLTLDLSQSEILYGLREVAGNLDIHNSLMSKITDINYQCEKTGASLLMVIAENASSAVTPEVGIQMVQKVLDMGARKETTDNEGRTAYDWASEPYLKNMLAITNQKTTSPIATNKNSEHKEYSEPPTTPQPVTQMDALGCVIGGICFFIPLLGLILFLIWREDSPGRAKVVGNFALVGFFITMLYWFIGFIMIL